MSCVGDETVGIRSMGRRGSKSKPPASRQHGVDTHEKRGKGVGGGHGRRELEVDASIDEAKESLPKATRSYEKLADVLAENLRSGPERAQEQRLDGVVVEARVSRVELRISDGAQNSEPLLQRRAIRTDVKNGRGIEVPEAMVFGAAGVGERLEVGGIGDDVGGAGKRP